MKKPGSLIFALVFCVLLAACGGAQTAVSGTLVITNPGSGAAAAPVEEPSPTPAPTPTPEAAAREAFAAALTELMEHGTVPGGWGTYFDHAENAEHMDWNEFAVHDVDGDGKEELVIRYISTITAGYRCFVVDYDREIGKLYIQLETDYRATFYENGAVQADWCHNQGRGGRFWPYTLYQYDRLTDGYTETGSVDAWDSQIHTSAYPWEIDVSGAGFVYYIYTDLAEQWDKLDPVDESEYLAWLDTYLEGSSPLELTYLPLTAEHIDTLRTES